MVNNFINTLCIESHIYTQLVFGIELAWFDWYKWNAMKLAFAIVQLHRKFISTKTQAHQFHKKCHEVLSIRSQLNFNEKICKIRANNIPKCKQLWRKSVNPFVLSYRCIFFSRTQKDQSIWKQAYEWLKYIFHAIDTFDKKRRKGKRKLAYCLSYKWQCTIFMPIPNCLLISPRIVSEAMSWFGSTLFPAFQFNHCSLWHCKHIPFEQKKKTSREKKNTHISIAC